MQFAAAITIMAASLASVASAGTALNYRRMVNPGTGKCIGILRYSQTDSGRHSFSLGLTDCDIGLLLAPVPQNDGSVQLQSTNGLCLTLSKFDGFQLARCLSKDTGSRWEPLSGGQQWKNVKSSKCLTGDEDKVHMHFYVDLDEQCATQLKPNSRQQFMFMGETADPAPDPSLPSDSGSESPPKVACEEWTSTAGNKCRADQFPAPAGRNIWSGFCNGSEKDCREQCCTYKDDEIFNESMWTTCGAWSTTTGKQHKASCPAGTAYNPSSSKTQCVTDDFSDSYCSSALCCADAPEQKQACSAWAKHLENTDSRLGNAAYIAHGGVCGSMQYGQVPAGDNVECMLSGADCAAKCCVQSADVAKKQQPCSQWAAKATGKAVCAGHQGGRFIDMYVGDLTDGTCYAGDNSDCRVRCCASNDQD